MDDQKRLDDYLKNTDKDTEIIEIDISFKGDDAVHKYIAAHDAKPLVFFELPKFTNLKKLSLETPGTIHRLMIPPHKTITELIITHQHLEVFKPSYMPALTSLNLSHNQLSELIMDKCPTNNPKQCYPSLKIAILNDNPLRDISTLSDTVNTLNIKNTLISNYIPGPNITDFTGNDYKSSEKYYDNKEASNPSNNSNYYAKQILGTPPGTPPAPNSPPIPNSPDYIPPGVSMRQDSQSQNQLNQLLYGLPKTITTININLVMYGKLSIDLNLYGLSNVQKIVFSVPGSVEQIYFPNPPLKLRVLEATDQHIETWNSVNMPYIEELNLSNNRLRYIDLTSYSNLKKATLNNNLLEQFSYLENHLKYVEINGKQEVIAVKSSEPAKLPKSLIELYVNNNRLSFLDLVNAPALKTLHALHNPNLKIANSPITLKDLKIDASLSEPSPTISENTKNAAKRHDYEQSLNMYYVLKSKYESSRLQMLESAYESKKTREDRIRALESVRPLCIQCSRPVGTLFMQKKNHKLYAKCGDTTNPCNLNITIFTGIHTKVNTEVQSAAKDLEGCKEMIIRHKMDTLFKYMSETEAAEKFKLLIENYEDVKYYYNHYLNLYNETYFSEVRKQAIAEKMQTLYDIATELNKTVDELSNQEAMKKYIDNYLPELQKLRGLKYEIMEMILPQKEGDIHVSLLQNEISLDRITHVFNEEPRILSFVYSGFIPQTRGAPKTTNKSQSDKSQSESVASASIPELEQEEEEEEGLYSSSRTTETVDVFDFETENHRKIFNTMSRHFSGIELYLRTAILIDYVYNLQDKSGAEETLEEIETHDAETLSGMTDMFDVRTFFIAWYNHYAPDKIAEVDALLQKYNNKESLLFNNLYRKYVDPNAERIKLWFD
mgnify:CR=1 FL=1